MHTGISKRLAADVWPLAAGAAVAIAVFFAVRLAMLWLLQ